MDPNQQKLLVNQIASQLTTVAEDLSRLLHEVVVLVENLQQSVGPLSGEEKQQVAVAVLSGFVKLPFPINLFQNMALKLLIKYTVSQINKQGHVWTTPPAPPVGPPTPEEDAHSHDVGGEG